MRTKTIKTQSGATYTVTEDGEVRRERGDHDIRWTIEGRQYDSGHLPAASHFDLLTEGGSFYWYAVWDNEYAEPISTSRIVSITEEAHE